MSTNFTGVTFAKQKVTPSYDGIVRRALLTDGTLTGCDMSYSGSTLTMAAGQLMICGRQIVHPSSQNWAVTEKTSGYARLVITIDLTRTSTKDNFDQVVDVIQYATSVDGFAPLEQSDINTSGTKYQVAACVVSLGTGGITGIVSKLEKCEGGGAGLNFKVVGGTTAPGSPTENTIWVNTSVAIPSWAFSATEPGSPVAGMVWISTGTSSSAEFNALKKNAIQVYPASAKQYVGGAWSNVEAWLYQNGEWVQFGAEFDGYLYNAGVFNEDYAGDALDVYAKKYSSGDGNTDTPTVAYNSDNVTITAHYGNGYPSSMLVLQKKIDLTGFSELQLDSEHTGVNIYLRVWSEIGTYTNDNVAASLTLPHTYNTRMTDTLDISSLSGEYYCGVCILGSSSAPKLTMYAMKLE